MVRLKYDSAQGMGAPSSAHKRPVRGNCYAQGQTQEAPSLWGQSCCPLSQGFDFPVYEVVVVVMGGVCVCVEQEALNVLTLIF